MTINKLGTVALASVLVGAALAGGVAAASATTDGALPNAAYFVVDLYVCTPGTAPADKRPEPTGAAAIVYEEVLMGVYGGNCDDFHAKEIRPRIYLLDGS